MKLKTPLPLFSYWGKDVLKWPSIYSHMTGSSPPKAKPHDFLLNDTKTRSDKVCILQLLQDTTCALRPVPLFNRHSLNRHD